MSVADYPADSARRTRIDLKLSGPPQTRHEAKHLGQGRSFPDRRTVQGVNAWRSAWEALGDPPPCVDGPVLVTVAICCRRPPSHYGRDGVTLNTTGRRRPLPYRPDVDNVAKLVLDALKRRAFGDDCDVGALCVSKSWGNHEHVAVAIVSMSALDV